jgi:hypothetical protein
MALNFNAFMEDFAREIGGQFSEYDKTKSVIIVPLDDNRFQTVLGVLRYNEKYDREGIEFSSKVCDFDSEVDAVELLKIHSEFTHARFAIVDTSLKVEASTNLQNSSEALLKEIIIEVATLADEFELKLTGMDVH